MKRARNNPVYGLLDLEATVVDNDEEDEEEDEEDYGASTAILDFNIPA